jgi:methylmalonyl-CoA mutase
MIAAVSGGWVAEQIKPAETAREKDIAVRKLAITGVSEHPTLTEHRTKQEQPDYRLLATAAAQRLSNWRRQHVPATALDTLTGLAPASGALTAAAVAAAEAGATLGQIAKKLVPEGVEPTVMAPLTVHPYDTAFEQLRDAAKVFESKYGHRPRVCLAGVGRIAEQVARANYARSFFEAGGFEVIGHEAMFDIAGAISAYAASKVGIAVICSTDKQYATAVAELAPKLKAAGAHTVVLAGHPGRSRRTYRASRTHEAILLTPALRWQARAARQQAYCQGRWHAHRAQASD